MKYKTIILDRDGVINEVKDDYVKTKNELKYIPGSINAINKLLSKYEVAVASNQAGVGRGLISYENLSLINSDINRQLLRNINFFYCIHRKDEKCKCRKPQPGLLEEIMLSKPAPYLFVGDNKSDYWAARNANIDFCFVKTGYGLIHHLEVPNDYFLFNDLESLTNWLVSK